MSNLISKIENEETLSFADYQDELLENKELTFDNIKKVNFIKCTFKNVTFRALGLEYVTFKSCLFINCFFENIKATYLTIQESKLTNVVFRESKLINTFIQNSLILMCSWNDCDIKDSSLEAKLSSCSFVHTFLSNVDFTTSFLEDLQINQLKCEKVYLNKAKLTSIDGNLSELRGSTISMEQSLDLIINLGIYIKDIYEEKNY